MSHDIDLPPIPAMLKRSTPDNPITLGEWSKDLADDVRYDLQAATNSIRFRMKRTVEDILEIGRQLCAVREMLPSDEQFGQWREAELGLSKTAATRMMQVHRRFGVDHNGPHGIEAIAPTVLYELAAPSTPDEVVEAVVAQAQTEEKITVATVKEQIAQAKALLSPEATEELKKDILADERREAEQRKKEREEKQRADAAQWNQDADVDSFFGGIPSQTVTITDAEYAEVEVSPAPEADEPTFDEAFLDYQQFTHPDGFPRDEMIRWMQHSASAHGITASDLFQIGE